MRKQICASLLTPRGDVASHGFLINLLRLPGFLATGESSQALTPVAAVSAAECVSSSQGSHFFFGLIVS
jgi:hypothetical protein